MALISLVLGLKPWSSSSIAQPWSGDAGQVISRPDYIQCGNPDCVTQKEAQNARAEFTFFRRPMARFVCGYCEREVQPSYFARPRGEVYYPIDQFRYPSWDASDSLFFTDANDAESLGLRPALIAARAEPLTVEVIR